MRSKPVFLGIVALLALGLPAVGTAETFDVDTAHSFFMFRAVRMGIANIYGRFNDFEGTLELEGDEFEEASITLSIEVDSVDTGVDRRDAHLRSPDFLNAAQIRELKFESQSIRKSSDGSFEVSGRLTLHGVTKEVTATVELVGEGVDRRSGKRLIGFDGTFTFQRSDFDMNFMPSFISDEIQVHLAVQAVAR